jgi:flagellar biosynthesis/type III secretory pathway protein FliH
MIVSVVSSSRAGSRLPPVDAHIVAEDSGNESIEGRLVPVPPAHEPHGDRHSKVNALLEAFVGEDYNVACDMLTRVSETTDVAPDASVYPIARDPETGGRRLEVLALQVVATETLARAAEKAALLAARGVRRVFAVDVERQRALEWSHETGSWQVLPDAGAIEDEVFVAPLPVEALVRAAKADDAVAAALLAKRNPVIVAARAESRKEGFEQGLERGREQGREEARATARRTLVAILESLRLAPTPAQAARIQACNELDMLARWTTRAVHARSAAAVFDEADGERDRDP